MGKSIWNTKQHTRKIVNKNGTKLVNVRGSTTQRTSAGLYKMAINKSNKASKPK
jgi:hypothetical protein